MHLDPEQIIETVRILRNRIHERFPDARLNQVCDELFQVARDARQRSRAIAQPMQGVRMASGSLILVIVVLFVILVQLIRAPDQPMQAGELIQMLEAGFSGIVLIGATILFLVTLEIRIKRARALRAIHELRAIAHIIDMHQLTKDPERLLWKGRDTPSSPRRSLTPFELNRYLDYCTEMLALTGKIAALYVDDFADAQAVSAVNDLESLTSGLSHKIWQKIMILHTTPVSDLPMPSPPSSTTVAPLEIDGPTSRAN